LRRDPASFAAIYLAFLQVGLEVADRFQAVFSHKTDPGISGRARHAESNLQTGYCQDDAVHVNTIAINESMPLPLAAVHWGMPAAAHQGPKTRRHGTAWGLGPGAVADI
jgi:hypothetical protein